MKKIIILLFLNGFILSCSKQPSILVESPSEFNSFKEISDLLIDPPSRYRPMAFWSLNGKLSEEEMEFQLKEFKDKGYGGVFLHPRPGLITEYLSDEWFQLCRFAMEKCKKLDMETWLYDENSFPSGFAGGHVQDRMPESYNQGVALRMEKSNNLPGELDAYKVILSKNGDKYIDITDEAGKINQKGEYILFELLFGETSAFTGGFPYVDLLVKGVTDTFLNVTMSGYEGVMGEEFGKAVPGLFTDEPNINRGVARGAIKWTPDLFEIFEEDWGYSLVENLPSLFEEVGDWKEIRHNYYHTLLDMFINRWSKPNYEYCEANNLKWTGHYWEHGWPSPVHGSDNMAMYAWHQIPGIDMLFNTRSERPDQFGNNRAGKELISVANQMGRARTLSETYGASGYDLNFEDMMRNGNWHMALGVNLMTQHLSYYSIQGTRKYDFPQTFSYHAPYWDDYTLLNDYFGRLQLILSSGQQINNTIVIEPTTSAWMYFSKWESNTRFVEIGETFENFIDEMESLHIEYDLGCENMIKDHGKAENAKFVINKRAYDLVILPPGTDNLDETTVNILAGYLKQGGKVISFEKEISYINGGASDKLKQLSDEYTGQWQIASSLHEIKEQFQSEGFRVLNATNTGGELYHHRRILEDGQLVFLTNFSLKEKSHAEVFIEGEYLYYIDMKNGSKCSFPYDDAEGGINFEVEIYPGEGKMFFASNQDFPFDKCKESTKNLIKMQPEGDMEITLNKPNSLVLDFCNLKVNGKIFKDMNYYDAAMEVYRQHGFESGNPWTVAVQFKSTLLDADTFPDHSGFEVEYPFYVENSYDLEKAEGIQMVVEFPHLYEVYINENEVKPVSDQWWLSRENGVYNIGVHVKNGKNSIKLICKPMSIFAEIEPVFLLGDFGVKPVSKGFVITNPQPLSVGSWIDMGLPTYTQFIDYSNEYSISDPEKRYFIQLSNWEGSVAEVHVNDQKAGLIYTKPYRLEISGWLRSGENRVTVRVIGSLKNLLGPLHGQQRKGLVTPWSWKYPPKEQPAGRDYLLVNYGLMEQFELVKGE